MQSGVLDPWESSNTAVTQYLSSPIAQALSQRIQAIATTSGTATADLSEEELVTPLSGKEMRELIYIKVGRLVVQNGYG